MNNRNRCQALALFEFSSSALAWAAVVFVGVVGLTPLLGCQADGPPVSGVTPPDMVIDDDPAAVGALNDPLSRPATATLSPENFNQASQCAGCHPNHYSQWKTSMHAYATIDPIWRTLVGIRQADFEGERDQFCTQCHTAIGTRGGEVYPNFSFDDFSPIALEGVTCEACHKVSGVQRVYNSGHVLDETGPIRGPIEDPVPNSFHESEYSPLHDTSAFCGACHDVIEQNGLLLERPFEEWASSPAAEDGRNCQSCHMPTYRGKAAELPDVPERDNIHLHRFIGVDMPLSDDFITDEAVEDELRAEIAALLQSAGAIELEASDSVTPGGQIDLFVTVRNLIDAHDLPTGSTFNRQLWVAVTATDGEGNVIYQTGNLDDNGDLRDYWSELDQFGDNDLLSFASGFLDERGNPTVFPWLAAEHISNSLSPLFVRTSTLFVPTTAETVGPITIEATLRFRSFPPFLLRALGHGDLVDKLEIIDIDDATLTIEVITEG